MRVVVVVVVVEMVVVVVVVVVVVIVVVVVVVVVRGGLRYQKEQRTPKSESMELRKLDQSLVVCGFAQHETSSKECGYKSNDTRAGCSVSDIPCMYS
jgi:hypothetical protein